MGLMYLGLVVECINVEIFDSLTSKTGTSWGSVTKYEALDEKKI